MKKIGKYFIISSLLLIGLFGVGLLYLFFVPNSTFFSLVYISRNEKIFSNQYSASSVSTIELNSNRFPVNILSTKNDEIYAIVHNNTLGFTSAQLKDVKISQTINDKILKFEITEPVGALLTNSSYIELFIPEAHTFDLKLKNNKSLTTLDDQNVSINNFSYSTKLGNFNLHKSKILGNLNLNLQDSIFTIKESTSLSGNKINLNLTTGKFDASQSSLGVVNVVSNERGIIKIKTCSEIEQQEKLSGGSIKIEKVLNRVDITSSDTNIEISELSENANNISLISTKSGNISIGTINSSIATANFNLGYGNLTINTAKSKVYAISDSGNITIKNAYLKINSNTNYGTVNIKFADDAESLSSNELSRAFYATLKSGKLVLKGVENTSITLTDNARADVSFKNVIGNNFITGNKGSVNVKVYKTSAFKLSTQSESGLVRVNLTQIPEYNGYTTNEVRTEYINCLDTNFNHQLTVKTNSGDLTLLDSNFA